MKFNLTDIGIIFPIIFAVLMNNSGHHTTSVILYSTSILSFFTSLYLRTFKIINNALKNKLD